jgi:subtilisin family serine protease
MRKRLIALAAVAAVVCAGVFGTQQTRGTQAGAEEPEPEYTGDVIVKFKASATLPEVAQAITDSDTEAVASSAGSGLVLLEPEAGQSVDAAVADLKSNPEVAFAEPDVVMRLSLTPNDSLYASNQWSLPAIFAPQAWDVTTGNANVIIAVIDTGVDATHPDLSGKITTGANAGYNFVAGNATTTDDHSHGTFVAGIAAASTNNSIGMAGACWTCKIMPIKVLDNTGSGSTFNVAQGIDWAVSHGADVINLSLGGGGSTTLQTAVNNAWNANVVVIAASGNENSAVLYPGAYTNAIAVGSTNNLNARSSFSNFGPELDIVAPGEAVLGTLCNCAGNPGGYATGSGTSFSTPYVAGVAGLLIASGVTDKTEIRNRLLTTATDLGAGGFDNLYGNGLLKASAALSTATPTATNTPTNTATPTSTPTPDTTGPVANITSPADGAVISAGVVTISATASDSGGMEKVRFWADSLYLSFDATAPYSKTWNATGAAPGSTHILKIEAIDNFNNSTVRTITVTIAGTDTTPPAADITSPIQGAIVTGPTTIDATASDASGINKVRFWVNSWYQSFDANAPYSKSYNFTNAAPGVYTLTIEAIDNGGLSTVKTITVTKASTDTTQPATDITSPVQGATVTGPTTINATASDASGINKVRFWVNSWYQGFDATAPFSKSYDFTSAAPGVYTLKIEAVDNTGLSTVKTITVTRPSTDTTLPTASITGPAEGATVSGTVTISATASDAGGIQKVRFWVDSTYMGFDAAAAYEKSWDTTTWANGVHTIKVQAVDLSNNEGAIVTINVTVSN